VALEELAGAARKPEYHQSPGDWVLVQVAPQQVLEQQLQLGQRR
jgi:hypothetical protein